MAIWTPQNGTQKDQMLAWARQRLPIDFGLAYPVGICRDGQLVCVCVFHNFRGVNIEMSIAADSPRWATKQAISFLLAWPFVTHPEVRRITALVERRNKRSRKLCAGIGFRLEGTLLDAAPNDDMIVFGLTRRWFERSRWHVAAPAANLKAA